MFPSFSKKKEEISGFRRNGLASLASLPGFKTHTCTLLKRPSGHTNTVLQEQPRHSGDRGPRGHERQQEQRHQRPAEPRPEGPHAACAGTPGCGSVSPSRPCCLPRTTGVSPNVCEAKRRLRGKKEKDTPGTGKTELGVTRGSAAARPARGETGRNRGVSCDSAARGSEPKPSSATSLPARSSTHHVLGG